MEAEKSDQVTVRPKSQNREPETFAELGAKVFRTGIEVEEIPNPIETAKEQNQAWHEITEYVTMNFRGKRQSFNEIVVQVRKECEIGTYSDLTGVRTREEKIGNLIADIYIQKAKAQYAYGKLESQRLARLGSFVGEKDRRSTAIIEARAAANDPSYQAIIDLVSDCKSTLDFWHDMYNICMRSTDRLKQISMALMAEMKLEPSNVGR